MNTLAKAAQQAAYILRRLDRNGYVTDGDKSKISEAYLSLVESLAFSRCIETEGEAPCKTHPDAPHGFDRNMSHTLDRYVCTCENWEVEE